MAGKVPAKPREPWSLDLSFAAGAALPKVHSR
jgi:hypothetical protein